MNEFPHRDRPQSDSFVHDQRLAGVRLKSDTDRGNER